MACTNLLSTKRVSTMIKVFWWWKLRTFPVVLTGRVFVLLPLSCSLWTSRLTQNVTSLLTVPSEQNTAWKSSRLESSRLVHACFPEMQRCSGLQTLQSLGCLLFPLNFVFSLYTCVAFYGKSTDPIQIAEEALNPLQSSGIFYSSKNINIEIWWCSCAENVSWMERTGS